MTGTCYLVSHTYTKDDILNVVKADTRREVICETNSIRSSEFHEAMRDGLSPEIELRTAYVNYAGETEVEFGGEKFNVYRTYKDGDYIELYCEKVAGV